jgi:hypothetical protein
MSTGKYLKRAGFMLATAGALSMGAAFTTWSTNQPVPISAADSGWHHRLHADGTSWGQPQAVTEAVARHYPPRPVPTRSAPSAPPVTPTVTPTTPSATSTPTAPAPTSTGTGSSTSPLPKALAGHPLVTTFSPAAMASSWNDPQNDPGGCNANPAAVSRNSSGFLQLTTTGTNCVSAQSPSELTTKPGYVYEAKVYFSTFAGVWPAVWMYGQNWPSQGEIDAIEDNYSTSYVTWHQANNYTIGDGSWNNQVLTPQSPDVKAGAWVTVDIAFTSTGVSVYYNGALYDTIKESVTTGGNDPMWLTISESGCDGGGYNECATGVSPGPGNVQVAYVKEFS